MKYSSYRWVHHSGRLLKLPYFNVAFMSYRTKYRHSEVCEMCEAGLVYRNPRTKQFYEIKQRPTIERDNYMPYPQGSKATKRATKLDRCINEYVDVVWRRPCIKHRYLTDLKRRGHRFTRRRANQQLNQIRSFDQALDQVKWNEREPMFGPNNYNL